MRRAGSRPAVQRRLVCGTRGCSGVRQPGLRRTLLPSLAPWALPVLGDRPAGRYHTALSQVLEGPTSFQLSGTPPATQAPRRGCTCSALSNLRAFTRPVSSSLRVLLTVSAFTTLSACPGDPLHWPWLLWAGLAHLPVNSWRAREHVVFLHLHHLFWAGNTD